MAQKQRRPGAAGQHHGLAPDPSALGDHAGDPARLQIERAHGAALADVGALRRGGARERRDGAAGLGAGIAGREQGALEAARLLPEQLVGLRRREQARVQLMRLRMRQPGGVAGEVGLGLGEIGDAAPVPADVLVQSPGNLLPEPERQDDRRQLARIAALLADPAPVARRLLAGDPAFFAQGDRNPGPGQVPGRCDARDAAADHDHLRGLGLAAHRSGPPVRARVVSAPPGWAHPMRAIAFTRSR